MKREITDRKEFKQLMLTLQTFSGLIDRMQMALPPEPRPPESDAKLSERIHISAPRNSLKIEASWARNSVTYHSMAELETDTTLPDVLSTVSVRVSRFADYDTTHLLRFEGTPYGGASLTARSDDEAWVAGQLQILSEYLSDKDVKSSHLRSSLKDLLTGTTFLTWFVGIVFVAISYLLKVTEGIRTIISAVGLLFLLLSLIGSFLKPRKAAAFQLIVREQPEAPKSKFSWGPIMAILAVIAIAVAVLAWIFPHSPSR